MTAVSRIPFRSDSACYQTISTAIFLSSLRKSVLPKNPEDADQSYEGPDERAPLLPNTIQKEPEITPESFIGHAQHTSNLFAVSFVALLLPIMPTTLYILTMKRSPPDMSFSHHSHQSRLRIVGNIGLLGMFVSAGLMRRRPELRYDPPKLGTGFGLKAGVYDAVDEVEEKDQDGSGTTSPDAVPTREKVSNVLDYDGCCLFSLIFVGYVSLRTLCFMSMTKAQAVTTFQALHIGFLSRKKEKLDFGDLPHLPYLNRAENILLPVQGTPFVPPISDRPINASRHNVGKHHSGRHGVHDDFQHVGSWELCRLLYRGKGSLILNCGIYYSLSSVCLP